jgi:predicted nucleic acid-binding protein
LNAFDADCVIYAAEPGHALGNRIYDLVNGADESVGSVMLLPELLIKPTRRDHADERDRITALLSRIDLRDVDAKTARVAVQLGAKYGLRAIDSVHLATAVVAGADRFVTNNRRDFVPAIAEIDVVYPSDL